MRDSILGRMAEYSTGASGNATEAECKDKPGIPLTAWLVLPLVAEQALDSSASVPCRADCLGSILPSTNALDSSLHIMPHAASLYAAFLRRSILRPDTTGLYCIPRVHDRLRVAGIHAAGADVF